MKHAWVVVVAASLGACGTSGEPMKGDVMYTYGTDHPKMVVGTAVKNKDTPTEMVVQLGDDNVDCSTYLNELFLVGGPSGTFVYFSVDATTPGTNTSASISAQHSSGNNTNINESTGTVTIDTIGARVTGSLMFSTTDQDVGTIAVAGSFDVKKCF